MGRASVQARLVELALSLPTARAQNRLMGCADRDLALALGGMERAQAEAVLALVSVAKQQRVREEMALVGRRRVSTDHRHLAIITVLEALERDRLPAGSRSYLRPHGRPRED